MPEASQVTLGIITIVGGLALFFVAFLAARRVRSWPALLLPVGAALFVVHGWLDLTESSPDPTLRSLLVTAGALLLAGGALSAWKTGSLRAAPAEASARRPPKTREA